MKVQTFFKAPGSQRYFIVNGSSKASGAATTAVENRQDEIEALLREWAEDVQQHEEEAQIMDAEVAKTDKTSWFNRTGWPEHLAGRNYKQLARAARLPGRDEPKLKQAAVMVEKLIERCVAGLVTLPRETRRWLKSAKASEIDPRPQGRLQNPETQARYAGYMKLFVCYFLRIFSNEEASSKKKSSSDDVYSSSIEISDSGDGSDGSDRRTRPKVDLMKDARELFPWQGDQKKLAGEFWASLDGRDEGLQVEALLRVLVSFIFQKHQGFVFTSGLIHFTAVLGIDAEMGRLRSAKHYSYLLAGVVYCVRVIGLEALLPASQREQQGDEELERFLTKRKEFLADGSYSPMSEMLSLLAFSKHIAFNDGNAGSAIWSKDKKTFYYRGKPIIIERFQQMAQDLMTELEDMMWQELFWETDKEGRFTIRLDLIQDDVTFSKRGFYFVNAEENGLNHGLRSMLERMMQSEEGRKLRTSDGAWNIWLVKRYLRKVNRFLEKKLPGFHMFNGQPPGGSEITTMRFRNGFMQDRNGVVLDGVMMTIIRYYKSMSQWDSPKVIPRFLPDRLGQVAAIYLTYIQPFAEYLRVKVLGGSFSDYIWADEHGPWGTDRLTRALKRETGKRLGVELNTREYRHVAVGIGRVVVGESFSRGYQDEVGEEEEPEMEEEESPLELQNSRSTRTGISMYGVPIDIIKHLSNRSIETFRPLSEAWHNFLGLGRIATRDRRADVSISTPTPKRYRELESNYAELGVLLKKPFVEPSSSKADMERAMRRVLGTGQVSFRSAEQEQAMHAVIRGQTPLVVVLPTGGGKSLLFTVPACLPDARVTVVVVPYRALIEAFVVRIRQSGIECIEWKAGYTDPAPIIVVSADVAGEPGFLQYAVLLDEKKLLRRVVVDECHLVMTSSDWRPKLAKLKNLRVLTCPMVLLTATLPPILEEELGASMLVRCATYIRASTVRPNIRYVVSWCEGSKVQEMAVGMCRRQKRRLIGGRKGIIYCRSKVQCEGLAEELNCGYYHAGDMERTERLQEWVEEGGLIVATSALGTGVDFPGIVFVLHVGMPWSMIDFAQESGRGGRAGEQVDSVILVEHGEVERRMGREESSIDVQAMGMFILGSGCRRGVMSNYLDGKRVKCSDIESAGCDRCGEGVREWQDWQVGVSKEWQVVQEVMDELQEGCSVCWVLGTASSKVEEKERWLGHRTMQCTGHEGLTWKEMDKFRQGLWDRGDIHSCRRCWVSQKYCATGEDIQKRCQWPNIIVPIAIAGMGLEEGAEIIQQCGFQEKEDEDNYKQYQQWLGKRHRVQVWGEYFSNIMVVSIKIILFIHGKYYR